MRRVAACKSLMEFLIELYQALPGVSDQHRTKATVR